MNSATNNGDDVNTTHHHSSTANSTEHIKVLVVGDQHSGAFSGHRSGLGVDALIPSGHPAYRNIANGYFRRIDAVLFVFDSTKKKTFEELNTWYNHFEDNTPDPSSVSKMLVANKVEATLIKRKKVKDEVLTDFVQKRNLPFLDVSAKSGFNVEECFMQLISTAIRDGSSSMESSSNSYHAPPPSISLQPAFHSLPTDAGSRSSTGSGGSEALHNSNATLLHFHPTASPNITTPNQRIPSTNTTQMSVGQHYNGQFNMAYTAHPVISPRTMENHLSHVSPYTQNTHQLDVGHNRIPNELSSSGRMTSPNVDAPLFNENQGLNEENRKMKEQCEMLMRELQKANEFISQMRMIQEENKSLQSAQKQYQEVVNSLNMQIQTMRNDKLSQTIAEGRGKLTDDLVIDSHDRSRVLLHEVLGGGGSGARIFKASFAGLTFAAKILPGEIGQIPEMIEPLKREIAIMESLDHENIVKYLGHDILENQGEIRLYMTLYSSTLNDEIYQRRQNKIQGRISPLYYRGAEICGFLQQIAKGLDYLHTLNPPVLHRDLKCENIEQLKIGDFDTSKIMRGQKTTYTRNVGTDGFMAPEVATQSLHFRDKGYTKYADVWSFGMIMYEIMTFEKPRFDLLNGELPHLPPQVIIDLIEWNETSQCWSNLKEEQIEEKYRVLIPLWKKCTSFDPTKRPDTDEILKMLSKMHFGN
ncbi:hypothetical protein PROFUN_15493 [Planoprotostelium fungivorum]|uniref:non-specific serine/threonine protein kinase n=1 Tax=Planoprotostelium fungivorum TaxID=1890364 RepID=A0A2P6MW04_9EUKA|nr:hypothetical protein PROFUN_15493 [Planoprotostelium fungivorum]